MIKLNYFGIAAATLLTASVAFAQSSTSDAMPSSPSGTMPSASDMSTSSGQGAGDANVDARAPATTMEPTRGASTSTNGNSYMSSTSGGSGTMGSSYSGTGRYAAYATGSQLNPNDPHATPTPGAQDNQLFRGGN